MSRAGSTLFFLPSPWIRGCCRTFNPEVFYIKYPTSYRNQAQDHYIQARVAGRGRTRTKRPLYYQSMSPDASRAAIGEYSKPTHLLAFIVQPARINVTCSAQGFPDSHRQIPNLSHYLYHVCMQSITDPPHTARFKVRSSRNPSKNESPIAYGLLIAGPLTILLRRVEKGGSLDHRRSAQEDRNECTRDVLAGGQSLSSAGGWHDGRSSSSGRSSGLGARGARSACAGCSFMSKTLIDTVVRL